MAGRTRMTLDREKAATLTADIDLRGRLRHYAGSDTAHIDARLAALDSEWELERVLETQAALSGLAGVALMAARGTPWTWLPVAVFGFMLQHAARGWSPPLTLFRRIGYRPRTEIEAEKYGLRLLRGDFEGIPSATDASPEVRAFRAWEALHGMRQAQSTAAVARTRPFRIRDRSTWIQLRRKREQEDRTTPVIPTDIRAENFLAHLRSRWQPSREEDLDRALRVILAHLKWRLAPGMAEPLFSHLPRSIAQAAAGEPPHGYGVGEPPKTTIDVDAFFDEISSETGLAGSEARRATSAIFSSMKRQLPAAQNRAMRAMLPKGLKRVWLQA